MKLKWVEKATDYPAGTEMAAKKWQSIKEEQGQCGNRRNIMEQNRWSSRAFTMST